MFHRLASSTALLAGLLSGAVVSTAQAGDWTAEARFTSGVEIDDNRGLQNHPHGETYDFGGQIQVNAKKALTPTLRFETGADISYHTLEGPGADTFSDPRDGGARLKIEKLDQLTKYYMFGSWRLQDAVSNQLDDSGVILARGNVNTYVLGGGLSKLLTPTDTVSLEFEWRSVDLSESAYASPYDDLLASVTWNRRLTPVVDFVASAELERMTRDSAYLSDSTFGRSTLGIAAKLSPQLNFSGMVGAGFYTADGPTDPCICGRPDDDDRASWVADVKFAYRPRSTTELSLGAFRTMAPSSVGEVQERSAVSATWREQLNPLSFMRVQGEFSQATSLDGLIYGTADYFRASVTYGYRLTPDWEAQLSYRFAERDDDTGSAQSNALFLSAVKTMDLLP